MQTGVNAEVKDLVTVTMQLPNWAVMHQYTKCNR